MTSFRVWAPRAHDVALVLGDRRLPMHEEARGWRALDVAEAGPGTDYTFSLDGTRPLPDPRSPFQPYGVHDASRLVDHAAFRWTDGGWAAPPLRSLVFYELHVGTFTPAGTFDAAIAKLDHLVDLGVGAVELMPVAEFPGVRGWGYDGVDLYAPHHAYGGPDALRRLVDACHARGLAAFLDVVYNHLGPSGNYLARFGPYFSGRYATLWGPAVNLEDPGADEARAFLIGNAVQWLRDYHFDGLRLDAVHAIVDTSAVHFLEELAARVDALEAELGRPLYLVAESDLNDPRVVRSRDRHGYGLDAQWSDDFHHALHTVLTGERSGYYADFAGIADLAKALRDVYVYDGRYSRSRDRTHGRAVRDLPAERFLAYLQNHDQVGNRARGERSAALMSPGRLKVAAALVLLSPFVPLLFMGEEWAASTPFLYFTDHHDPEVARSVTEGRRREFAGFWAPEDVPDPQSEESFRRSKLDWDELSRPEHREILDWHRTLIALRGRIPDLAAGHRADLQVRFDEGERWLVVERGASAIACNLGERARAVAVSGRDLVLASDAAIHVDGDGVLLPRDSVAVVRR